MHYLGKLKQRMYVCDIEAGTLKSGDKVVANIDGAERNAGTIVSIASASTASTEKNTALVALRVEMTDAKLSSESSIELKVRNKQPYAISSETNA